MPAEFCLSGVLALSTLWETDIKDVGMQQGGVGIRKEAQSFQALAEHTILCT